MVKAPPEVHVGCIYDGIPFTTMTEVWANLEIFGELLMKDTIMVDSSTLKEKEDQESQPISKKNVTLHRGRKYTKIRQG